MIVLAKEDARKSEFLKNTEKELGEGLYHQALASARGRLAHIPGDVDARIVIGRALAGIGEVEEAAAVLEGVEADILRWKSLIQRSKQSIRAEKDAELARSEELVKQPSLLPEFKTATMAELYIKQGHFDTAREVLNSILDRDPDDVGARLKLKKLDLMESARRSLPDERRLFVLNELESWLERIGRSRQKE